MQVKKSRGEFFDIHKKLQGLAGISGFKIAYAIMRIKAVIESEGKKVEALAVMSPEYSKFDKVRDEVAKSYAEKDAVGNAVIIGNQYKMSVEDRTAFDAKFEELKKENADVCAEREKQKAIVDAFVAEEVELDCHGIKKEMLPENISVAQLEILAPFIVDLEDKK